MASEFAKVSEASGVPIADEAASMMVTRYLTATDLAAGGRTLELACGSGLGLRILAGASRFTVGADIDAVLLEQARSHYRGSIPLVRLSAEGLPFKNGSFDLVVFLEATYYVPNFTRAIAEIDRVLSDSGQILFVNANPERPDFIRSPFSQHYHSADEFRDLLTKKGFAVTTSGAFPVEASDGASSLKGRVIALARRVLEGLGLVPNTLEGRARLKRLMGQKLREVPAEIDAGFAPRAALAPISAGPARGFKVIYVAGRRGKP